MSTPETGGKPGTSRGQDAVRILLIIAAAAETLPSPPAGDPALREAVAVLRSQVRLQKLDFWVRNPEYFANELLAEFEETLDVAYYHRAEAILESDEPQVRRYPMLRYLFGAFEPLDDALAVLRSTGLVVRRKIGSGGRVHRHDYYLTGAGRQTAGRILTEAPVFDYFVARTRMVAAFAEGQAGTRLKERQYEQDEYRNTAIGDRIESIDVRVRERLRRDAVLAVSAVGAP